MSTRNSELGTGSSKLLTLFFSGIKVRSFLLHNSPTKRRFTNSQNQSTDGNHTPRLPSLTHSLHTMRFNTNCLLTLFLVGILVCDVMCRLPDKEEEEKEDATRAKSSVVSDLETIFLSYRFWKFITLLFSSTYRLTKPLLNPVLNPNPNPDNRITNPDPHPLSYDTTLPLPLPHSHPHPLPLLQIQQHTIPLTIPIPLTKRK